MSNRFRTALTDVTQLRGPDIESDHNLLKINFKEKLRVKTGNKYNEKRKMVNIFQNPKWKQQYAIEINTNFEMLENINTKDSINNNIHEKWENIKTTISLQKRMLVQKHLKMYGKMRNANLQKKK